MDQRSAFLTRQQIASFINDERGIRAFETLQTDNTNVFDTLSGTSFLALANDPSLGSERVFTPLVGDLVGTDAGANGAYTVSLAPVGTAGTVGANTKTVAVTTDAKGRVTGVTAYDLNTSNIIEGTNLFYTDARARAAISASTGVQYNSGTGLIKAVAAGTYGTPTGTLSRTTYATYTAGATLTYSAAYVQAEQTAAATRIAAIEAQLQTLSETLAALITDMQTNGNLS